MSNVNFHPAPGLGDLLTGWYVVPQNPLRNDSTVLVPSVQATAPGRVMRKPRLGEFLPATFTVLQNPIAKNLSTGMGGLACGCAGCGGGNSQGLQGFDISSVTDWAKETSPVAELPNWALWGGAGVIAWMVLMPGGREYRAKKRVLASEYRGYRRAAGRLAA